MNETARHKIGGREADGTSYAQKHYKTCDEDQTFVV